MLDLNNQLALEQISYETSQVICDTERQEALIRANQQQSIKLINARAVRDQIQNKAKATAEKILAEAESYKESKLIDINAKRSILQSKAQTRLNVA